VSRAVFVQAKQPFSSVEFNYFNTYTIAARGTPLVNETVAPAN
jgi:hypothetical protein